MSRSHRRSIRPYEDSGFQMTPMIDVVFLLLIFFICTTQFPEFEGKFEVRLPDPGRARRAAAPDDIPEEVIVRVTEQGELVVNDVVRTEEELTGLLTLLVELSPKQTVIVDGEPAAVHRHVVRVLNACYRAGVSNISFAAMRDE